MRRSRLILAFLAIYLIWGSTYFAIRLAVESIPPLAMMSARCLAAGLILFAWSRRSAATLDASTWRAAFVAGGLLFLASHGSLAWAEQRVPSGIAALLSATTPFWLAAFEWSRGSRPSRPTLAGLIGLAGVAVLVGGRSAEPPRVAPILAILCGTLAWAAGSLYARPPRVPRSLALSAGMSLTVGGVLLLAASWGARELTGFSLRDVSSRSLAALAYLVVFGSLVGFSAYAWLLRVAPPSRVATHAYVNPLVAIALGSALAGEPLTSTIVCAGLVIAAGVALALAGQASGLSRPNKDQIPERGARMARRDDREYREYLREEQRSQLGCPARKVVLDRPRQATSQRQLCHSAAEPQPKTSGSPALGGGPYGPPLLVKQTRFLSEKQDSRRLFYGAHADV